MSGGRLVVLDNFGQAKKVYPLEEGLATIGSDHVCDIRVLLPTVSPHHATVVVHTNQAVVRSVSGETLVNGAAVSVAALRHGDELRVGGRVLRWEYAQPQRVRHLALVAQPLPALVQRAARARRRRRDSEPSGTRTLLQVPRPSMPASISEKQIAIVQPQRRDTNVQAEASCSNVNLGNKRPRTSRTDEQDSITEDPYSSIRRRASRAAPLRLSALRAAHRQRHSVAVAKIRAPAEIDHTKQAAIMLMTGHTPKAKRSASLVLPRPSPVPRPRGKAAGAIGATPKRASTYPATRTSRRGSGQTTSVLEITESDSQTLRGSTLSERSLRKSSLRSPLLPSPKKSALKDPSARKSTRKTESIKFDLSNLGSNPQDRSSDILFISEAKDDSYDSESNDELTLHYSDSSSTKSKSPSPRKSIHSRSSCILEKSLGTTFTRTPRKEQSTSTPESPRGRKSLRSSLIVQKALENSSTEFSEYSRRTTKTLSDQSYSSTIPSARKTKTPRSSKRNLESYSIVDLVSIDSNESVYNSADSSSTGTFDTPQTIASRRTRSNNPSILGSSTPYLNRTSSPKPDSSTSNRNSRSRESKISTRRSASMTTPKNTRKQISFNSARVSKASRSRSRINDSDVQLVDDGNEDSSPKSSRRISKASLASPIVRKNISLTASPCESPINGTITPENQNSPEEATTPVLSIQSFLDQSALSQTSSTSQQSQPKTRTANLKRKTIGANTSQPKRNRMSIKSRSLDLTSRRSLRAKTSNDASKDDDIVVTPKSAVKLVHEGVKNKHSTAKKPTSKRSIIDNLDESAFVKQLFNSPVKRKLSQSMIEFSRKELLDNDDIVRKPTRNTIAFTGRTPENSLMNNTEEFTPEVFVSPLSTPDNSPNLSGVKRLFAKTTPENDLRNVRGVKSLLRTPRNRKSIKNDLSNISGVKRVFAKSPRNRLSDVRVKEVFASPPKNDLRRVSGVKALFQSVRTRRSPTNTLEDVRGVKNLYRKSPSNNLQRVSGVKDTLRVNSPRNDLSDVRGVKQLYRNEIRNDLSDLSGVEELFYESNDLDSTFDQLIGKPRVRSYVKSKSFTRITVTKKKTRKTKSLHDSIGQITNNVEEWLENELKKRVQKHNRSMTPKNSSNKSNITRELQKLTTDTIEGTLPIRTSRVRNSTLLRSINWEQSDRRKSASELYGEHTLPIKKRSLGSAASGGGGGGGSGSGSGSGSGGGSRLPIKKRAVLHSTPLRGAAARGALDASELRRVSPIAHTRITENTRKSQKTLKEKMNKSIDIQQDETSKPSPRRTRGKATVQSSPQVKQTRGRKTKDPKITNAKKRRSSIVITKKPPVMSPKAKANTKAVESKKVEPKVKSPKQVRSTRQKSQVESIKSPRKTRAKNQKSAEIEPLQAKSKPTRQAKTVIITVNNDDKQTRRRKTTVNISNNKTQVSPEKVKRTRKTATDVSQTKDKTHIIPPPVKRGRRNAVEQTESDENKTSRNTRKKAAKEISEDTQKELTKQASVESQPRSTRGRKAKESAVQEIGDQSKPIKESIANKSAGRQRKKIAELPKVDDSEVVVRKSRRGAKAVEIVDVKTINEKVKSVQSVSDNKKGRRGAKKSEVDNKTVEIEALDVAGRKTRNTAQKQDVEVKPSRGNKKKQIAEVVQEVPKPAGRKRKTNNDQTDTKEAAQAAKRRRATPEQRTVGRSRRR